MPLKIKPCHLRAARDYVGRYHRHSIPPVGGKFAVACYDGDDLCGVAICGRPVARYLDDGLTLEILRRWPVHSRPPATPSKSKPAARRDTPLSDASV